VSEGTIERAASSESFMPDGGVPVHENAGMTSCQHR
jgi:hypothetical protein